MSQKQQERLEQEVNAGEGQVEAVQTESTSAPFSSSSTPTAENADRPDTQEMLTSESGQATGEATPKKRKKRKTKWVSIDEVSPKPSYWPLALTLSLCVLLMGVMIHPIVIGVGAVLVISAVIGWILERR